MSTSISVSPSHLEKELIEQEHILIVDDDALVREALGDTLKYQGYHIFTAEKAKDALELIKQQPLALIICDMILPEMNGSELLQEAEKINPDIVRVALTGSSDINLALEAINVGHVSHFIMKPWNTASLIQIVGSSLEKYRLIRENKLLEQTILSQHKELEKNHQALRYELQLGARIHDQLLLGRVPDGLKSIDLAGTIIPSKEIDGDFFDFYHPSPALFDIAIGDVMGKGIPAALIGIALKMELQRFGLPFSHAMFCDKGQLWQEDLLTPANIVRFTDEAISPQLMQLEFFATLFYGRFDFSKQTFTYVDCGSPKPFHYSPSTGKCKLLAGDNFPIGVVANQTFQQVETLWQPDDLFVFYSDGVTECSSPENALFGIERLQKLIKKNASLSAKDLLEMLKNEILKFSHSTYFDNDVTLVVAKMKQPTQINAPGLLQEAFKSDLSEVPKLRNFINRLCKEAPGDKKALSEGLQLAIHEAFCNIVKHSYKGDKDREILIRGEKLKEGILIDLSDLGDVFDPCQVPRPNLSNIHENGNGLYMMSQIADKLIYLKKGKNEGWNRFRIFKNYAPTNKT